MKRLVLGLIIVLSVLGSLFACSTNGQKDAQVKAENESATTVVVETMAQIAETAPIVNDKGFVEVDQSKFIVGGNTAKEIGCISNDMKIALNDLIKDYKSYIISFSEGDDFSLYNGMSWGVNVNDIMKDLGQTNIVEVNRSTNGVIQAYSPNGDLDKVCDGDLEIGYTCDNYSIALFFDKNTKCLKVVGYLLNRLPY